MSFCFQIESDSPEKTEKLGEKIASYLKAGDYLLLDGSLGAGKTAFTRGLMRGLRSEDFVSSPTFSLMNLYTGTLYGGDPVTVVHCDAYRLNSPDDLYEIGFFDFDEDTVYAVEWSDNVFDGSFRLPSERFRIRIQRRDDLGPQMREIFLEVPGDRGIARENFIS